jgi:hypothetical protein
MPLTDTAIHNAKPRAAQYKLSDSAGLYLLVAPTGSKWWRLKYRFGGKEKLLSLGVFDEVSLAKARKRRDAARELVADGIDPSAQRKVEKCEAARRDANSFEAVALEWHGKAKRKAMRSPTARKRFRSSARRNPSFNVAPSPTERTPAPYPAGATPDRGAKGARGGR